MIIELYGLPGSGKTTLCNKLKQEQNFENIMYFYRESFLGKVYYKLFQKLFYLNPTLKNKYNEILNYLKIYSNKINIIDNSVPLNLYIKYIIFVFYIEKKYKAKSKKICIDEGIIHLCMAINVEYDIPLQLLDKIIYLCRIDGNTKYISMDCNVDTAIKQIKIRNRKRAPIDYLKEDELKKILEKYKNAQNYFDKKYK